jgi:hypothetical protein
VTAYVVEVDEGKVEATRQGVDWWMVFRARFEGSDRIRETKAACVVGGVAEVRCDDQEGADWLAAHMVAQGLPRTAVKVKRGGAR